MRRLPALLLIASALLAAAPVEASKSDREQKIAWTSDQQSTVDLGGTLTVVLRGNVVISQGTMRLEAAVVRVQQTPDGYAQVFADGMPERQVAFHQARDEPGESIEGQADRIEYDTHADTIRLIGRATLRQLRGTAVASEANGELIVYDNRTQQATLDGNAPGQTSGGRVRGVLMPRAASAAAPSAPASGVTLQPSTALPRSGKGS